MDVWEDPNLSTKFGISTKSNQYITKLPDMSPIEKLATELPESSDNGDVSDDEMVETVLGDLRQAMMEKWIPRDRFIRFLDRDASGTVSFEEFREVAEQFGLLKAEEPIDLKKVFNVLDKGNAGEVPIETFMKALESSEEDFDY